MSNYRVWRLSCRGRGGESCVTCCSPWWSRGPAGGGAGRTSSRHRPRHTRPLYCTHQPWVRKDVRNDGFWKWCWVLVFLCGDKRPSTSSCDIKMNSPITIMLCFLGFFCVIIGNHVSFTDQEDHYFLIFCIIICSSASALILCLHSTVTNEHYIQWLLTFCLYWLMFTPDTSSNHLGSHN